MTTGQGQGQARKLFSLNPETHQEGSAIPTGPLTIMGARYTIFDYGGKANPGAGLMLTLADDSGNQSEQFYSMGDPSRVIISEDGNTAGPTDGQGDVVKSSNLSFMLRELVLSGFPNDRLTSEASCLINTYAVWQEREQPSREGLPDAIVAPGQQARKRTAGVPSKLITAPWETSQSPILLGTVQVKPLDGQQNGASPTAPTQAAPPVQAAPAPTPIVAPAAPAATTAPAPAQPQAVAPARVGEVVAMIVADLGEVFTNVQLTKWMFGAPGNALPDRNEVYVVIEEGGYAKG